MIPGGALAELERLIGADAVRAPDAHWLVDGTEARGLKGRADAVVLPRTTSQVARVVEWCYRHDVPITPRGGGSGLAGGAVPDGGVILAMERLRQVRSVDAALWRMHVEAGIRTADVQRLARENGLLFPPDPGAAEQSQIGGNIATNAGGPHAFKYGVTGAWVTGLEAVVPPGEVLTLGGPIRKDVSGYDLKSLLVGSEGTLAVITAAWLRLLPAPEATAAILAFFPDTRGGCAGVEALLGYGVQLAALDFLDGTALQIAGHGLPGGLPARAGFMLIGESHGTTEEVGSQVALAEEALAEPALDIRLLPDALTRKLWQWRDSVSLRVTAHRGGKLSEDIVVPVDRLGEAIAEAHAIAQRHTLEACTWGHAGDGNLHCALLFDREDSAKLARAQAAADDLLRLASRLGGAPSGEHGIGVTKRDIAARAVSPPVRDLQAALKAAFDPKNLLNPGKKI